MTQKIISAFDQKEILRAIKGEKRVKIVLARDTYRWAKNEYRRLREKEPLEVDFREPTREKFWKLNRIGILFGLSRREEMPLYLLGPKVMQYEQTEGKIVLFCTGLQHLDLNEANGLAAITDNRYFAQVSFICDYIASSEIAGDSFTASTLGSRLYSASYDYNEETISTERLDRLQKLGDELGELLMYKSKQLNIYGPSRAGKTTLARIIAQWNRTANRLFEPLDGTWKEIELERISPQMLLIIDEATRFTQDALVKVMNTYPRLILLTHQPILQIAEENRIDLGTLTETKIL